MNKKKLLSTDTDFNQVDQDLREPWLAEYKKNVKFWLATENSVVECQKDGAEYKKYYKQIKLKFEKKFL